MNVIATSDWNSVSDAWADIIAQTPYAEINLDNESYDLVRGFLLSKQNPVTGKEEMATMLFHIDGYSFINNEAIHRSNYRYGKMISDFRAKMFNATDENGWLIPPIPGDTVKVLLVYAEKTSRALPAP